MSKKIHISPHKNSLAKDELYFAYYTKIVRAILYWSVLIGVSTSLNAQETKNQLQASQQQESYDNRIHNLERANENLSDKLRISLDSHNDLKGDFEKLEAKFEKYEPFMQNWNWILGGFGTSVLVVIGGFLFWFYGKALPKLKNDIFITARADIDASITKVIADQRANFMAILKEYDKEQQAKEKYNIVMLTHKEGSDNYHFEKLTNHGFKITPLSTISQLNDATFNNDDVLIINNEGEHWELKEIEDFINTRPNLCYYIGRGVIKTNADAINRFAAVNIRTQFIGNLMNMLKYHN